MITRRRFVFGMGVGTVAPLFAFGQQQTKLWRIGFLWEGDLPLFADRINAFKAGMAALGYVEGQHYAVEHRSARSDPSLLAGTAAELIALKVDLIHAQGTKGALAAQKATREIPILIATIGDPVGIGLASSLRKPGGNVTGLTSLASELKTKHLDWLRKLVPGLQRAGFLFDPGNESSALGWQHFQLNCRTLNVKPLAAAVRNYKGLDNAFNTLRQEKAQGFIVSNGNLNIELRSSIIEFAAQNQLPAVYPSMRFAEAGALLTYYSNDNDLYRRSAAYADKIFRGEKPGNLPIEQPTKFELVINMKTARSLGIKIPQSILVQATKVIE